MNRNDVVFPTTGNNSDVKPHKTSLPVVSPRQSPRVFDSYRSPRLPKSAGSSTAHPTFPKGALLEEKSVHLPMPSFHERMGWECAGCRSVNQSVLSNECSVCGMLKSVDFDSCESSDMSESMAGDDTSYSSIFFDGNASESSLSHHNFSILDHKQPEKMTGHMSLPVVLQSSTSSLTSHRTTRTSVPTRRATMPAVLDDDSTVISFRHWNGNNSVKPWDCAACTYRNDNPLHLVCEMCGHRRDAPETAASAQQDLSTTEEGDEELELLRTEQIRELIDIQRDILSQFGTRNNNNHNNSFSSHDAFHTADLQREIAELQQPSRLDYNDIDGTEYYELERIKEVIRAQQEIMMDFQKKRDVPHKKSLTSPGSTSSRISGESSMLLGAFNQPNTTPNQCLKASMKAARGMLRQEDLVLPILWGDDLGKADSSKGSKR
ncbi:hypothetical protein FisN_26Hh075 [Fistulifera solaris]|uniref:RanBP2-type domain-containing protein n=1 Tax=Fistulifera solaris TaxID=1519565 RepID=A0A1Z5JY10_FISSO|nr:hypothetical protein FisN_26Hh075 [Fistulifera solaris]|eukprot:GAX18776.1 hypothetical protein FisN_26Hh075 [Fistulifera solaris]